MRVLIVAATRPEIEPLLSSIEAKADGDRADDRILVGRTAGRQVDCLVTGVGMVATAVWCTRTLASGRYDLALNLGVCGSFNAAYPPSSVVHVTSEMLPELGAEDGARFLPMADIGLVGPDEFPWRGGRLINSAPPTLPGLAALPSASGITVNTVHGDDDSIARVAARCAPDVESMEGAAFMYACLVAGVPFAEVRAVSNVVERRNRAAWNLGGAMTRLNETAVRLLS
ncbi:MAG: futalosine hydrolase [Vicinamibacterales bacterium]